ncbi:MAG: hypothetical protein KDI71_13160, partial [Xanthomonadales bacterium]|nr:hypothetical protein [Xanthomonadales bacterium]
MPVKSLSLLLWLLALWIPTAWAADESASLDLSAYQRQPGLLDLYPGDPAGRVLVGVRLSDSPLLLVAGLPGALGSNEIGLDRNRMSDPKMVSFRRSSERLLLIQHN